MTGESKIMHELLNLFKTVFSVKIWKSAAMKSESNYYDLSVEACLKIF